MTILASPRTRRSTRHASGCGRLAKARDIGTSSATLAASARSNRRRRPCPAPVRPTLSRRTVRGPATISSTRFVLEISSTRSAAPGRSSATGGYRRRLSARPVAPGPAQCPPGPVARTRRMGGARRAPDRGAHGRQRRSRDGGGAERAGRGVRGRGVEARTRGRAPALHGRRRDGGAVHAAPRVRAGDRGLARQAQPRPPGRAGGREELRRPAPRLRPHGPRGPEPRAHGAVPPVLRLRGLRPGLPARREGAASRCATACSWSSAAARSPTRASLRLRHRRDQPRQLRRSSAS